MNTNMYILLKNNEKLTQIQRQLNNSTLLLCNSIEKQCKSQIDQGQLPFTRPARLWLWCCHSLYMFCPLIIKVSIKWRFWKSKHLSDSLSEHKYTVKVDKWRLTQKFCEILNYFGENFHIFFRNVFLRRRYYICQIP